MSFLKYALLAGAGLPGLNFMLPSRPVAGPLYRPRGHEIGLIRNRGGRNIPVYYNPPAPTLLNRSKHWKAKATYADARRHAFDRGLVTSLGVR